MPGLFDIAGKVALVSGGSRGIGRMIAEAFVESGVKVYISSRKAGTCDETARELSGKGECISIPADLSTEAECRRLADAVGERESRLDILVNNAGTTWVAPLESFGDEGWDKVLDLNVKGVFHLTRFLVPLLEAAGTADAPARVINISSVFGTRVPLFEVYSYGAAKAAVDHLTRHLAVRLAPRITVNAIAPGPFETKQLAATLEVRRDQILGATLLARVGRPEEIAGTAVFLASPAGAYTTGAVIPVDGGIAIGAQGLVPADS